MYILTEKGKQEVKHFIRECEAKRKEILDAKLDTADDTELPTEEDILADLNCGIGLDEDMDYYNGWGVTDNYNADNCCILRYKTDFVEQMKI